MNRALTTTFALLLATTPLLAQPAAPEAVPAQAGGLITLNVQQTPLGSVLESIAVSQRVNIVANVDTAVPVTANFWDATLEQALDWVLTPLGLSWVYDGQVYTVMAAADAATLQAPLVHHVFRPNYISAAELERFLTQFLSPRGRIVMSDAPGAGIPSTGDEAGGMTSTLPETLVVIDTQDTIERMAGVVGELDEQPRQVLVEATILEVRLDESSRFGVDFALLDGAGLSSFESLAAPGSVYSAPTLAAPGDPIGGLTSPTSGAPFLTPSGTTSIGQSGFSEGPGSTGMRIGYVGDNAAIFIDALQTVADTNVLANTKVLALNKMRGELIIGGRLGYFGGTTVSDGISQQTVEFLEIGTQLRFRPYIGNDGYVRLEIHPQRSSGVVDPVTGLPAESTSEVTTNVMVRDGETVVIGGLIETRDVNSTSRVPFLGYLPLVGWLFSSENIEVERTEIVVLLTPRILENGARSEPGERLLADHEVGTQAFRRNYGDLARVEHARRVLDEARAAMEAGRLSEARALGDRSLLLDPLADGALAFSAELDARIAGQTADGVNSGLDG